MLPTTLASAKVDDERATFISFTFVKANRQKFSKTHIVQTHLSDTVKICPNKLAFWLKDQKWYKQKHPKFECEIKEKKDRKRYIWKLSI